MSNSDTAGVNLDISINDMSIDTWQTMTKEQHWAWTSYWRRDGKVFFGCMKCGYPAGRVSWCNACKGFEFPKSEQKGKPAEASSIMDVLNDENYICVDKKEIVFQHKSYCTCWKRQDDRTWDKVEAKQVKVIEWQPVE